MRISDWSSDVCSSDLSRSMRIFLFSLNYAPELTGTGLYSGGMAESLAERGHDVTVFASHPFYPDWQYSPGIQARRWTRERLNGVTVHRSPVYLPRKFNAIRSDEHTSELQSLMRTP